MMAGTGDGRPDKSAAELVADLTQELTTLVHQEIELAKAELAEKGKRAGLGAGMFGGAGLLVVLGLGCLTAAAVVGYPRQQLPRSRRSQPPAQGLAR